MTFSDKASCSCNRELHVQDIVERKFDDNREIYVFRCSDCQEFVEISFAIFGPDGHINKNYLRLLNDNDYLDYWPKERLEVLLEHLRHCQQCKATIEEQQLQVIEDKIRFGEKCASFFEENGRKVAGRCFVCVRGDEVTSFEIENISYDLKPEDEFYRNGSRVYYFIKSEAQTVGMVSFKFNGNACLDKIWFRSPTIIEQESHIFEKLRRGQVKMDLDSLKQLYETLS